MSEELPQLLQNLRLRKMAQIITAELAAASKSSPSYTDFLARLLRAEWLSQQERKMQSRIKLARIPELWTIESFPFKQQPGVSRRQLRELAELEFIPKAVNIVFIGPTGVGKTGLASGLLLKACRMAIAAFSSKPRSCSTTCMPPSPTVPRASCSSVWRDSMY